MFFRDKFVKKNKYQKSKFITGFTLVELLVVIAIIGMLTSMTLSVTGQIRLRASDIHSISDLRQINNAIDMFYEQNGYMPKNYNCGGVFCASGNGNQGACDAPVPGVPGSDTTNLVPSAYSASMQELVTAGFLPSIPHSNGGPGYCYFNWSGLSKTIGAVTVTSLQTGTPSSTGILPSCRPFNSVNANWCDQGVSLEYCLCNLY